MPTNAELAKIVEQMQRKLEEQEDEIANLKENQGDLPVKFEQTEFSDAPEDGGWLVKTPNPKFSGNTNGIRFVQGMAVVPKDAPNAAKRVRSFISEFHYSAVPVDKEELSSLNMHITSNLARLLEGSDKSMEEKLVGVTPLV